MNHKKNINILYIAPYSPKAYGAEEQDIQYGLKLLQSINNASCHLIKIDMQNKQIHMKPNQLNSLFKLSFRDKFTYILNLLITPDHAMRQAYTYKNYKLITQFIISNKIDVVFTNTTSTVLFGIQSRAKHVFRSVSFEPVYVLKVVSNGFFAIIHAFLKFLSVFQELRADIILAISPRDAKYYGYVSAFHKKRNIEVLPLRQLVFREFNEINIKTSESINVGFLGSTYNVMHNKKSFDFISNKLDYEILTSYCISINVYGRKIPKVVRSGLGPKIHNYVNNVNEIYRNNLVFLAPYYLASGMQSKVFEPLVFGRILVCDSRVLAGYKFVPFVHYIPAITPEDFTNRLLWIKNNLDKANLIGRNARSYSLELFNLKSYQETIQDALTIK